MKRSEITKNVKINERALRHLYKTLTIQSSYKDYRENNDLWDSVRHVEAMHQCYLQTRRPVISEPKTSDYRPEPQKRVCRHSSVPCAQCPYYYKGICDRVTPRDIIDTIGYPFNESRVLRTMIDNVQDTYTAYTVDIVRFIIQDLLQPFYDLDTDYSNKDVHVYFTQAVNAELIDTMTAKQIPFIISEWGERTRVEMLCTVDQHKDLEPLVSHMSAY